MKSKGSLCTYDNFLLQNETKLNIEKYKNLPFKKDTGTINYEIKRNSKGFFTYKTDSKKKIKKITNYDGLGRIIWTKLIYVNGNEEINVETYYNNFGTITKTIDHEKGYNICWAEAIEIVKQKFKNKLSKYDSVEYVLQRVDLNEFPNEKPVWSVGIVPDPDDKIGETTYYKIDGVTGKYLGKFTARMVPN